MIKNVMVAIFCLYAFLLIPCVFCQEDPFAQGFVPNASFQSGDVDSVNLQTGNLVISAPIYSLPQRGRLKLSYSIVGNTPPFYLQSVQGDPSVGNFVFLGTILSPAWPSIIQDEVVGVNWSLIYPPCNGDCAFGWLTLRENNGAAHNLYEDIHALGTWRAVDASGYTFVSDGTNLEEGSGTIYDIHGVAHQNTFDPTSGQLTLSQDRDLDGNVMTGTIAGPIYGTGSLAITDTENRTIAPFGTNSTGTVGCPNMGDPHQPLVGSSSWVVPGPNGLPIAYLICFAEINIRTNFYNGYTDPSGQFLYAEYKGHERVIQSIVLPNLTYWSYIYDSTDASYSVAAYGTLSKMGLPDGGNITYKYQPFASADQDCNLLPVVQRTVDSGDGVGKIWKYQYNVAYPGSPADVLTTTVVTDPDGNDTAISFSGAEPGIAGTYDNYPDEVCAKKERYRHLHQGLYSAGKILQTTNTTYQSVGTPDVYELRDRLAVIPTSVQTIEGGGQTTTTTYSYDPGFIASLVDCSGGCSTDTYAPSLLVSYGRQTSTTVTDYSGISLKTILTCYESLNNISGCPAKADAGAYLAAGLLDTPNSVKTFAGTSGGTQMAETDYTYDSGALGHVMSVTNGLGSQKVTTYNSYNSNGTLAEATDANGMSTSFTYNNTQCAGALPSKVTDALGQSTNYIYDCVLAKPLSVTDPNLHTTNYTYSVAGDITSIGYPDGGSLSIDYHNYSLPLTITEQTASSPDPTVFRTTTYDGLGRATSTQLTSDPSGADHVDTTYDGEGRIATVSNPYRLAPSSYTYHFYDALGRPLEVVEPDGSLQRWCYNGVATPYLTSCLPNQSSISTGSWSNFIDEAGNQSQKVSDALGRLQAVMEPDPASESLALQTVYTYDVLNNLKCVDQWGTAAVGAACSSQKSRTFSYDSLSRLITAFNPETGTVCYGIWSGGNCINGYDANGNLKYKTDTTGVTVSYGYNDLNMLVSKSYPLPGSPSTAMSSCYEYGTSTSGNTVERLLNEWTQKSSCPTGLPSIGVLTRKSVIAYDSMGRITQSKQCVLANCTSGALFPITQSYDLAGNNLGWTDGISQNQFTLSYDGAGRLASLISTWGDALHPPSLFTVQTGNPLDPGYSPSGQLQKWMLGTNINLVRGYDSRLRPTSESVTHP